MTTYAKIINCHRVSNSHNIITGSSSIWNWISIIKKNMRLTTEVQQRYVIKTHTIYSDFDVSLGEHRYGSRYTYTINDNIPYIGTTYSEILLKFSISIIISNVKILLGWWKLIRFCFCFLPIWKTTKHWLSTT